MHQNIYKLYVNRAKKFFERLPEYFFQECRPLTLEFSPSGEEIVPYESRQSGKFRKISVGDRWAEQPWQNAWFHVTGQVPKEWRGAEIVARFNFGGEALLFDKEGVPFYAFSVSSIFSEMFRRDLYPAFAKAKGGEKCDWWIEAAANQLFGAYMNESPALTEPHPYGTIDAVIQHAEIGIFRREIWHLHLDFEVLLGLLETIPEDDYRHKRLVSVLNEAVTAFGDDPANASKCRQILKENHVRAWDDSMQVTAVGHAHIDTGWLWRTRESVRKCARTYANQLYNIEHYPDYVFGASQAQHYKFVKDNYPKLYAKIKKAVKAGRWELQGGMWVECDCNLTSGESMVRQFLHGKNFFRDEFGIDVRNVWIPDVFGYSAAMPQICRLAGCDFFLTQKISWNQVNVFPYHTFLWEGIDGTTLMTHFPPENMYLTELNPAQLVPGQNRYSENVTAKEFVSLFGMGDGGGGPKQEYIERGLRLADLGGCPQVHFGTAQSAFDRMQKLAPKLPRWTGELYLELHRGTYTTQAKIKKGNRKLEQLLTAVEIYLSGCGRNLTAQEKRLLDESWKTLLINQFHDILPGSSIGAVYQDTYKQFRQIEENCRKLLPASVSKSDKKVTICNTLSGTWRGVIALPGWSAAKATDDVPCIIAQEKTADGLQVLVCLPPFGRVVLEKAAGGKKGSRKAAGQGLVLENELIRYEFKENGELVRAFDKELDREFIGEGQRGNVISMYIDRSINYEAWDHDIYFREGKIGEAVAVSSPVRLDNALGQRLDFKVQVGNTVIDMSASLPVGEKRLDFEQHLDWQENRRMLRVSFEAAVHAESARCDIQYGYARRVTHKNTSWEQAKFEVPIHRYADLTDTRNGFALLNDCKYGVSLAPSGLDLMLLRSTKYPDWTADLGEHSYRYAFLPHQAEMPISRIINEAADFNRMPLVFAGDVAWQLPCWLSAGNVRMEVVKPAEKSSDLILRLVEIAGLHSDTELTVDKEWSLSNCDLLEWEEGRSLKLVKGSVALTFHPFEIKTLRLKKK